MEWQPIETAPQKGYVLVWDPYYGGIDIVLIDDEIAENRWPGSCTYWMPLPEPPERTEK